MTLIHKNKKYVYNKITPFIILSMTVDNFELLDFIYFIDIV